MFALAKLKVVFESATEACDGPNTLAITRCPAYDRSSDARRDAWLAGLAQNREKSIMSPHHHPHSTVEPPQRPPQPPLPPPPILNKSPPECPKPLANFDV